MKRVFVDTDILLERVRDSPLGREAWSRGGLDTGSAKAYIPAVCAGELLAIAERNRWGQKKRSVLEELLAECCIVQIATPETVNAYALIQCWTQGFSVPAGTPAPPPKERHPMGQNDLWIAATVYANGGSLLTADKGFLQLHGVWFEVLHVAAPAS